MSEWSETLDLLEDQLRRQESAMSDTSSIPDGLDLLQPTSPMTEAELVRATGLLERTDTLLYKVLDLTRQANNTKSSPYA